MVTLSMRGLRVATVVLLVSLSSAVVAQNPTTRLVVQVTHLKPDRVGEWRALQREEVNPALREAGIAARTVLETMFGDRPEYITIRQLASFAEYDGEGPLQKVLGERKAADLAARLQACEVSTVRYIVNRQDDLSVGSTTAPVWVTTTYRPHPGAGPLYREFVRDELLPLNQKAVERNLISGFGVSTRGIGSPDPGLWIQTTYLPSMAALDAGGTAVQVLGQEGAQLLNMRGGQLRTIVRTTVRRRVQDLSY